LAFSARLIAVAVTVALASSTWSAAQASGPARVDQYGGVVRGVAPATGFFQVKQIGDRWMFVTPEGNGMWMTGVFAVAAPDWVDDFGTSSGARVSAKYGGGDDWKDRWRINAARRLKAWGFNVMSAYHHWHMRPGSMPGSNPEGVPYIHIINPARDAITQRHGYGTGPVKDLIVATDSLHYNGWRGSRQLDFFDPNWETYADGWIRGDEGLKHGNIGNPWLLGISMDETDTLFGFGPGLEVRAPRLHTHPGLIALITNFEQASSPWVSSYADRKVYTKYALRDFLAGRYGTIAALNSAWGSTYTTFDSEGGWGTGTGLLDENGSHTWVGKWHDEMATGSPAVRADLDDFLYLYAKRYFAVMAAKMRQHAPGHLVFGPASLNGWGGLSREGVLRAAGESVDVLQAVIGSQTVLDRTAAYAGNVPLVTWDSISANPDSALWRYPNPEDFAGATRVAQTQHERGQRYADKLAALFDAVSPAGVHTVAGMTLWAWSDHFMEKANFGLVTLSDNAYDGQEAAVASGTDEAGYATGGEERNYGDFLSAATAANASVAQSLAGTVNPPPCSDCEHYAGTLSTSGSFHDYPGGGGYSFSGTSGEHKAWLRGPAGSNFTVYLYKREGSFWKSVNKASGSTVTLSHVNGPGLYKWRVYTFSTGGAYDFWMKRP
jgi:hypothetical protein